MVDHLRSDTAQMSGLFVEAVLYGIYLVSLGFVLIYVLRDGSGRWRTPSGVRAVTFTMALILGINCTLNLAWGLTRMMQVYIFKPQMKKRTWMDLAKPYTVIIQTLTADLFLTYRCWIVYGKSWKLASFPISLSIGSLAVFVWIMVIQTQLNPQFGTVSHQIEAAHTLQALFTAQFALTTALNVYATSLVVYRIAQMDRMASGLTSTLAWTRSSDSRLSKTRTRLQKVIQIIVESALIYTVASTMTFATYKSNAQYIISAGDIMAVGLTFNLIIIRLARESHRVRHEGSTTKLTTLRFYQCPPRGSGEQSAGQSLNTIQFSPSSETSWHGTALNRSENQNETV